uniref:Uncharacterized protein n=1 Tax=Anguilla anguilla TaxID=7936 RepID=A0A0E9V2Y0_ANGAN
MDKSSIPMQVEQCTHSLLILVIRGGCGVNNTHTQ